MTVCSIEAIKIKFMYLESINQDLFNNLPLKSVKNKTLLILEVVEFDCVMLDNLTKL